MKNYKTMEKTSKEDSLYNKWSTGRSTLQTFTNTAGGVVGAITLATAITTAIANPGAVAAITGVGLVGALAIYGPKVINSVTGTLAATKNAKQGLNKQDQSVAQAEIYATRYNEYLTDIMKKLEAVDAEIRKNIDEYKKKSETMSEVEFRSYIISEITNICKKNKVYVDARTNELTEKNLEPCAMGG